LLACCKITFPAPCHDPNKRYSHHYFLSFPFVTLL
jgi:hypothetical protein